MALRGTRPSLEEIQQVIDNPDEIYNLAETYVESSEFTETVKDLYAETLKLRAIESQMPVVGALDDYTQQEVHTSLTEEPCGSSNMLLKMIFLLQRLSQQIMLSWMN